MEVLRKYYVMGANAYEVEKKKEEARKKQFKFVRSYKNFDLYEHKKYGYKECFLKDYVSNSK